MRKSTLGILCLSAACLAGSAFAQLSPAGFTGAANTPTADVLEPGTASAAWSNSNPEKRRQFPDAGSFGSLNLGFGVLPGLELVGRLAFDGDLECNLYGQSGPCRGGLRDLSASGKYQLPIRLDWDTRLALGAVDVGGAATNFRSYYGVATSSVGAFDFTLGYARGRHTYSSLDGIFGSTQVFLTDRWQALAEYDGRELRAGMRYSRPLSEHVALALGASRKLSNRSEQQAWQAGIGLTYSFGRHALTEGTRRNPAPTEPSAISTGSSSLTPVAVPMATAPALKPASAAVDAAPTSVSAAQRAGKLAQRLRDAGFSNVSVGFDKAGGWLVQAEPLFWRRSRLDALGVALAAWQKIALADERLQMNLTYLQDPVLGVRTTAACLARFTAGAWWCDDHAALVLDNGQSALAPNGGWTGAPAPRWAALRPQIEIGPILRQRVGTEYGLYDASLGLDLGWELPLGRGLLWQGVATFPMVHTDDFAPDKIFGSDRVQSRLESSTLSYQRRLTPQMWAQASAGYVQHNDYGGQLDFAWLSAQGDWRLSALGGYYQGSDTRGWTLQSIRHPVALAAARWSVIYGRWFLEAQAGQFYNQDRGLRLSSQHWFGDNRLSFHYRSTESNSPLVMPRTRFAGFELTIPLGGSAATALGPITVRGRDQWAIGIESKVGGSDNLITAGYGVVPALRHGLLTDTLDYDRAGELDVTANLYRVRAMLREMADRP